ncbi:MAG: SMC-Scp complex subunit ScpB [Candidatus Micrarchaeota archaeon]
MAKGKVHVYVKPKGKEEAAKDPVGVIKTSAKGEIIKKKERKEEKEFNVEELKEIVSKTYSKKKKKEKKPHRPSPYAEEGAAGEEVGEGKAEGTMLQMEDILHAQEIHKITRAPDFITEEIATNYNVAPTGPVDTGAEEAIEEEEVEEKREIQPVKDIGELNTKHILEAALFMSGQGVKTSDLAKLIRVDNPSEVHKLMRELTKKYKGEETPLEIIKEDGGKWVMRVNASYAPAVNQFAGESEISRHALRTLAYISENDGITKRDLFKRLGSMIYTDVVELVEKGFLVSNPSGRTSKLNTTRKFRQYFGV